MSLLIGAPPLFSGGNPPIEFVASAQTQNAATSTTLVIAKPAGTIQGDLMVAFMGNDDSAGRDWTNPAGWTQAVLGGPNSAQTVYKIAGASEGADYTFTHNATRRLSGVIVTYRFAKYDVVGTIASGSTPLAAPEITVTAAESVLLAFFMNDGGMTNASTPTGMSVLATDYDGTDPNYAVFSQSVGAGATGTRTSASTGASGADFQGNLIAIGPA